MGHRTATANRISIAYDRKRGPFTIHFFVAEISASEHRVPNILEFVMASICTIRITSFRTQLSMAFQRSSIRSTTSKSVRRGEKTRSNRLPGRHSTITGNQNSERSTASPSRGTIDPTSVESSPAYVDFEIGLAAERLEIRSDERLLTLAARPAYADDIVEQLEETIEEERATLRRLEGLGVENSIVGSLEPGRSSSQRPR